ncbi:MAG TPA: efflux RND transporter periplasmic adaptor subunit [Bacillota bacterium]|nr:efflux RND transporter periplasmic adaptor subunit [Bacillota bacterium]
MRSDGTPSGESEPAPREVQVIAGRRGKRRAPRSAAGLLLGFSAAIALAAAGMGVHLYLDYTRQWVSTDNAFVQGPIYTVSSTMPGVLRAAHVQDGDRVAEGDLLLELDSELQQLAVRRSEAAIAAHRLAVTAREAQPGRLPELEMARAHLAELELVLEEARLIFRQSRIAAPASGYVAEMRVKPGEYVLPGQPLLSVVNLDDLWVVANFTEEQIGGLTIGQAVEVRVDALPGEQFQGRVEVIMPASGASFALFPPDAAAGNWVPVPQRIPVRIEFIDEPTPTAGLRIGMLARVRVRRDGNGSGP